MQPIPPIRAAARSRRAHRRAVVSVVGFVGLLSCASTASAEDILFANTVSYSIVGRVGASGVMPTPFSQNDFVQNFNTLSIPAKLEDDLYRVARGLNATGEVSATIAATANFSSLAINYDDDVRATTFLPLNTGYGIVDSFRVTARWQDTLIFRGNEPGRTTTIAATLKLDGDFYGFAASGGKNVDAAYGESSLSIEAYLDRTRILQVSPYTPSTWGLSIRNALPGTNPLPLYWVPPKSVTLIMTFTQGQEHVLDYRMAVGGRSSAIINLAGSEAEQQARVVGDASFGNTLTWGGITSVTDTLTGLPLDNYSLTSASGINYAQAVPEPSSCLLATAAAASTMLLRRLRR